MKELMSVVLALVVGSVILNAEEFTTGGIYTYSAPENFSYVLMGQSTQQVEQIVVGKTYHLETDVMELTTKADESVSFVLSTGLQIKVQPSSTFSVDAFNQLVVNDVGQPSALKAEYSVTALSLFDGDVELIAPEVDTNSSCILQTPLVNVNVAGGRLVVRANPKYVILNSLEGNVVVVDARNKKTVIDKGNLGLIIPYPGRVGEIMVTQKAISPDELKKFTDSLNELSKSSDEVLFIVKDKEVIGVRLK